MELSRRWIDLRFETEVPLQSLVVRILALLAVVCRLQEQLVGPLKEAWLARWHLL